MWFRPLLGGGCVDSTDGAEQTDGRNLPPERLPGVGQTNDGESQTILHAWGELW